MPKIQSPAAIRARGVRPARQATEAIITSVAISRACYFQAIDALRKRELIWDKTERYRTSVPLAVPAENISVREQMPATSR